MCMLESVLLYRMCAVYIDIIIYYIISRYIFITFLLCQVHFSITVCVSEFVCEYLSPEWMS